MRPGCLIIVAGILVAAAGLFAWQTAKDSPGWQLSQLFKVAGLVAIVLGAVLALLGMFKAAAKK